MTSIEVYMRLGLGFGFGFVVRPACTYINRSVHIRHFLMVRLGLGIELSVSH